MFLFLSASQRSPPRTPAGLRGLLLLGRLLLLLLLAALALALPLLRLLLLFLLIEGCTRIIDGILYEGFA